MYKLNVANHELKLTAYKWARYAGWLVLVVGRT